MATAEATQATMNDGRQVPFAGTKKMLKSYTTDGGKVNVRFDFVNGHTIDFELPDQLVLQAAGHGVSQKGGDSAAGEQNVEDMILAVQDTLDNLAKGNWRAAREGGGFGGAGVVVRALCEVFGKTPEQIKIWIDGKIAAAEKAGQKLTRQSLYSAFRTSEKVGPKIKELEAAAAKGAVGVDAEAMLGELG
jgi:hypothetical protein